MKNSAEDRIDNGDVDDNVLRTLAHPSWADVVPFTNFECVKVLFFNRQLRLLAFVYFLNEVLKTK